MTIFSYTCIHIHSPIDEWSFCDCGLNEIVFTDPIVLCWHSFGETHIYHRTNCITPQSCVQFECHSRTLIFSSMAEPLIWIVRCNFVWFRLGMHLPCLLRGLGLLNLSSCLVAQTSYCSWSFYLISVLVWILQDLFLLFSGSRVVRLSTSGIRLNQ